MIEPLEPETILLGAIKLLKAELNKIRGGACQWKVNLEHASERDVKIHNLCIGIMLLEHIADYLIRQEVT